MFLVAVISWHIYLSNLVNGEVAERSVGIFRIALLRISG